MGEVKLTIEVLPAGSDGPRGESVEVIADTGATPSVLPRDLLARVGINPKNQSPRNPV